MQLDSDGGGSSAKPSSTSYSAHSGNSNVASSSTSTSGKTQAGGSGQKGGGSGSAGTSAITSTTTTGGGTGTSVRGASGASRGTQVYNVISVMGDAVYIDFGPTPITSSSISSSSNIGINNTIPNATTSNITGVVGGETGDTSTSNIYGTSAIVIPVPMKNTAASGVGTE